MKVTEMTRNSAMVFNLTLCKSCQKKLVNTLQFVRLKSLYTVLGVSPTASQKEIRDAYIKLSKENHPDQNRDDKKSHEKFVLIKEAYETLSKDISRRDYDMKLRKPSAYPRSPNYYSSGDFYQDQQHHGPFSHGPYGSETSGGYHYNPYTNRAHQQQAHDPFSEYNYEYYQRQREKDEAERMFDDDHQTFLVFKNRIMVVYSWLFLMPLFGMIFLAVNESAEDEWIRQQKAYTYYYAGGKYPSDAYIKRLALFYVYGYVIGPFLVIAMIFRQAFKEYYYEAGEDKSSTLNMIKIGVTILLIPMLLLRGFAIYITLFNDKNNSEEKKRYSSPKAAVDLGFRRLQITIALLIIPFLMIRWLFWYMTLFQGGSPPKPPPKPDTKPESRQHLKIVLWRFLRRYWILLLLAYFFSEMSFNILLSGPDGVSYSTIRMAENKGWNKDHDNRAWKVFMYFAKYKFYSYILALVVIFVVQYEIHQKDLFHLTKAKEEEKPKNWHGTRTEPKPKPKGADDYRMINFFKGIMFGMIFLMGASVAYEIFISVQIQMLEAEAWESGSASKSKILFYLALYSAIVYVLSKREVERRKLKKQQDEHMAMSKPHSQRVESS